MNKMSNTTLKTFRIYEPLDITTGLLNLLSQTTKYLKGEVLIPRTNYRYVIRPFIQGISITSSNLSNLIRITRINEQINVIGIDSTCIPLAESKNGLIVAARVAMVQKNGKIFKAIRIGPIIAYLNNDTLNLLRDVLYIPRKLLKLANVEVRYARKILLEALETAMLIEATQLNEETMILIDGSLKEPSVQFKNFPFKKVIRASLRRGNFLIGISKRSNLFKWCFKEFSLLASENPPIAVLVEDAPKYVKNLWGEVFFALLAKNGVPLRVDVMAIDSPEHVLNLLYSNDLLRNGYPETLRKAHIYSKFLNSENVCLRLLLTKFESKIVKCEKEREVLFGSFNKSAREWEQVEAL